MNYLTVKDLQKMDKTEEVYVRTIILYAHKARIQQNPTQIEAWRIIKKAIANAQDKKHMDYVFVKMCAGEVLLVFEKYFKDYKDFVTK